MCLRKDKKCWKGRGVGWQTEWEAAKGKARPEEEEKEEEMLHGTGLFIADCGGPALKQVDILDKNCGQWPAHAGAKEEHEKERTEERNWL